MSSSSSSPPSSFPAFAEVVPALHPVLARNIRKSLKFTHMTEIQALTWEAASQGKDVLGRARTGTGKTMSFLLPALQQLLHQADSNNLDKKTIHMLVLSPTRELASQIYDEAGKLTADNKLGVTTQVVFGGSSKPKDISSFERRIPTLLVATPGRLRDHLDNTSVRGKSFASLFRQTSVLVLDETDRLLDMGFQKEVNEIIQFLPSKQHRQTLLFSATVPQEVKAVMARTMKPDYITADCIHDTDPASHTNEQVQQRHVTLPYKTRLFTGTVQAIWEVIQQAKAQNEPLKMIVFFTTANLVAYYASVFNEYLKIKVLELHSRKSQSYRTRTADQFRAADEAILFTSDVSARGVDYPGVTNVIQVGIADSRESYIHRLGRTGRAGKVGEGLLVLCDLERQFLNTLDGIDVPVNEDLQTTVNQKPSAELMKKLQPMIDQTNNGRAREHVDKLENAYRSMLGFYNGKLSKQLGVRDPAVLIDFVNEFGSQAGCTAPPGIEKKMINKMGLRHTTGLNITANRQRGGAQASNNRNSMPERQSGSFKPSAAGQKRKPQDAPVFTHVPSGSFSRRWTNMTKSFWSLWLLAVFASLVALAQATSQGDGTFLSPYESIRALDEFGNAKQLDFASKAAQEQSSLVILLQDSKDDQTWIVSLPQRPRAPHLRTIPPLVHRVSMPSWGAKHPAMETSAFVVCTGLQGDARWLMKQLRQYTSRLWAMSDLSTPTGPALAQGVANLMRLFWGYPTDVAISSSVLRGVVEKEELARPLGLQVSVLFFDKNCAALPHVYDINPTGNIVDATSLAHGAAGENERLRLVSCMGSQHQVVRETLEEALSKASFHEHEISDHKSLGNWLCHVLEGALGPLQGRTLVVQQLAANGTLTPEVSFDV